MDRRCIALLAACATLLAAPAPAIHPDPEARARYCRQHPGDCTDVNEERRAQLREWCEENPVDCDEERQAVMERHRQKQKQARHTRRELRDAAAGTGRPVTPAPPRDERPPGPPR